MRERALTRVQHCLDRLDRSNIWTWCSRLASRMRMKTLLEMAKERDFKKPNSFRFSEPLDQQILNSFPPLDILV